MCVERELSAMLRNTQQSVPVHPAQQAILSQSVCLLSVLVMVTVLQINPALATNVSTHVQYLVCVARMLAAPLVLTSTSATVRPASLETPAWAAPLSLTALRKLTVLLESSALEASVSVSNRFIFINHNSLVSRNIRH